MQISVYYLKFIVSIVVKYLGLTQDLYSGFTIGVQGLTSRMKMQQLGNW